MELTHRANIACILGVVAIGLAGCLNPAESSENDAWEVGPGASDAPAGSEQDSWGAGMDGADGDSCVDYEEAQELTEPDNRAARRALQGKSCCIRTAESENGLRVCGVQCFCSNPGPPVDERDSAASDTRESSWICNSIECRWGLDAGRDAAGDGTSE